TVRFEYKAALKKTRHYGSLNSLRGRRTPIRFAALSNIHDFSPCGGALQTPPASFETRAGARSSG
ncbi:MAG TPA: hypothetical protein VK433_02115, partial [Stellaceae bacterium]|nr:hypothetical protein [Stellaceae bacterium]